MSDERGHPPQEFHWALPESLQVPADELRLRLDFYNEVILMQWLEGSVTNWRTVSPQGVAAAISQQMNYDTGILPADTLWWQHTPQGDWAGIWRRPQVTRVAVQMEAFKPAERFTLPMPGLVFICRPMRAPWVFAAKRRPTHLSDELYHCPAFNVYRQGLVCAGTHHFPADLGQIPESFFQSLFTHTGDTAPRSKAFGSDILALWKSLDGKRRYPLGDLVRWGTVSDAVDPEKLRR
jgi:PRTRC genetic system protein B